MKIFTLLKSALIAIAVALAFGSCSNSKLQQVVDSANAQCPYSLGTFGTMTSVTLDSGNVVFTYEVANDSATLQTLEKSEGLALNIVNTMLANPDNDTKELLELMVSQRAGMRFVFRDKGGEISQSAIEPDVLKVLISNEKNVALDKEHNEAMVSDTTEADLAKLVEETNKTFPLEMGNGMTLERIEIEGSYIVYHCLLNEQDLTIKAVEKDAQNVKKTMLKAIPRIEQFKALCKAYDKGLIYRYRGEKSGNTFGIVITAAELGN